jgi:hypothetical protein
MKLPDWRSNFLRCSDAFAAELLYVAYFYECEAAMAANMRRHMDELCRKN